VFRLPESWVWDFWLADDGRRYHLFFLYASRALRDPHARHHRASIGHAVSDDLVTWERLTDALVRSDAPAFDDLATWTGSIVDHLGTWHMYYTGCTQTEDGIVQRIGLATSTDLMTWEKYPEPVLEADSRWYEKLSDGTWSDETFRDPWVFADPRRRGWHMLITARANRGPTDDRGVIGHAWSRDLRNWELRPPLSQPGQGFGHLEVPQYIEVDGERLLLFSCHTPQLSRAHREGGATGGVWVAQAAGPIGPMDIGGAHLLLDHHSYGAKVIRVRDTGENVLLCFRNADGAGRFVGELCDPLPVHATRGRLHFGKRLRHSA
jgi:beta-fructofuranosidase